MWSYRGVVPPARPWRYHAPRIATTFGGKQPAGGLDWASPFGTAPVTPSPPAPPPPSSLPATPSDVVSAYYAAINARDYRSAFRLGDQNIDPSYDHFVAGDRVNGQLAATQVDGSVQHYTGYDLVSGGVITEGHLRPW